MSQGLIEMIIATLREGIRIGMNQHKHNGHMLPTLEVHELQEAQ